MPLRDVAKLVPKHSGELITTRYGGNQPKVNAKVATGQREGIDAALTKKEKIPSETFVKLCIELTPRARSDQ